MASPATFNVGDVLAVFAPTTPDSTAAGFGVSFLGSRVL
jgi:hypothetical protein